MYRIKAGQRDFEHLATEILEGGNQLRFQARGISMFPTIQDGDYLVIRPASEVKIRRGSILLCKTDHQKLVIHRAVEVSHSGAKKAALIKGDNSFSADGWIPFEDILGEVVAVERNGNEIDLASDSMAWKARIFKARLKKFIRY